MRTGLSRWCSSRRMCHFPADCQQIVKDALLRIAHSFCKSTRAGADRVVWSAIRRASSLLAPAQAGLLVPFLEREGVVDARAVTLKCVEKLFLPAPPADPESVRQIGERAHMLAKKFLDPDIFGGGDNALLAEERRLRSGSDRGRAVWKCSHIGCKPQ